MSGRRNSYVELDSAKKSKILAPYYGYSSVLGHLPMPQSWISIKFRISRKISGYLNLNIPISLWIKVPIFLTFWRNQVLHSYFSFLTWQLRNIEVAEVCGRPQNFVVNGFVKPSNCLLKRGPESSFLVSVQYLGPWASWKVGKPYLYIKSKNNVGQLSSTFLVWAS